MDLSRQRSGRPGGPNPSPIQGAQGRMRRPGRSPTPQVLAPVEITAHEWRSMSGAARPPFQTDTQSRPGRGNDPAGWPAGHLGHGTPASERADASAVRSVTRLTWGCAPTPLVSPRARATASLTARAQFCKTGHPRAPRGAALEWQMAPRAPNPPGPCLGVPTARTATRALPRPATLMVVSRTTGPAGRPSGPDPN